MIRICNNVSIFTKKRCCFELQLKTKVEQIEHSFEVFYKKYQPSLVHFATYLTHNSSDAVEIVNDVFVNIWHKRDTLQIDESLKSYLFTAVKNRCFNFNRQKKIETLSVFPDEAKSSFTADGLLLEKEQRSKLAHIMNRLPPKCRQIFAMSRIDELTYGQIAALLDISTKTVEAQITKALKICRENLKLK